VGDAVTHLKHGCGVRWRPGLHTGLHPRYDRDGHDGGILRLGHHREGAIAGVGRGGRMTTHIALFSGGKDSLVATHYAHQNFPIDYVAYLDTNSGLPENLEYVQTTAQNHEWELVVEQSPMQLSEFAEKYGFPGPAIHTWAFAYFKERQIDRIAKRHSNAIFYTGVRSQESERRMRNVKGKYQHNRGKMYVAPIHDFSNLEVSQYIQNHDLKVNPSYETIGRSGDCYCGAYAHRSTELGELQEYYPEHYEFIKSVESNIEFDQSIPEERKLWGFGGLSKTELRSAVASNDDRQMILCSNCDVGI